MTMSMTNAAGTATELQRFADCIFSPGDAVEVRPLPGASIFTTAGELHTLAGRLQADNDGGKNIYVGANPRRQAGDGSKAEDCDGTRCGKCGLCVKLARCLFADFDQCDLPTARARLGATSLPSPTLTICSGHGVHVYWRLAEAITDLASWTGFQQDLAALLDSDRKVKDPPRIMRLPGFLNVKAEPVPCLIIEADASRVYELCDLADAIPHVEPLAAPPPAGSNGTHSQSNGLDLMKRAAAWLAKRDPAIEGAGGDSHTFSTAAGLVNDFGLSADTAWPLLREWNQTCSPPWDETKLREKLENAIAYAKNSPGCKASALPPARRPSADVTGGKPEAAGPDAAAFMPTYTTAVDLLADNPELNPPVIEDLLREGELLNLISASKVGKSWLTLSLALSIATGRHWLDRFPVQQGDVLLIDNELHAGTIASRIKRVADAMGVDLANYGPALHVEVLRGHLQNLHTMTSYFHAIEPGRYRLIILDAFYRFLPPGVDENKNADMCGLFNILDAHAQRLRSAFVLVHHASKGLQSDKAITDVGSGAGAIARATDTHLILRAHEQADAVTVEAAIRSWKPLDPFCLRWQWPLWRMDPTLDPADLRKAASRRTASKGEAPAKEAKPQVTPAEFVARYVKADPAEKTLIIARATQDGISQRQAKDLLALAESERMIHRWVSSKKTDPIRFATREPSLLPEVTK